MAIGFKTKNIPLVWTHVAALLVITAWGISFVSTKVLLDNNLTPTEVFVTRTVVAYLVLLAFCHKKLLSNSLRDETLFLSSGLCGSSLYFIAENTALEYTLVSNVSLIVTLAPLITTFLVGALYKSERPSRGMVAGSMIAFLGVGCVIFNSSFVLSVKPLGDLLALSAAFSWAVYSLVIRKLSALYSALFITRKTFFYGILTALPFLAFETNSDFSFAIFKNPQVWGNFLFLGLFCSMIAFYLWAWVIKNIGAIKANNYLYIQPIVTLIASAVILHEKVSIVGYTGCTLILVGVWLSDRLSVKRPGQQHG